MPFQEIEKMLPPDLIGPMRKKIMEEGPITDLQDLEALAQLQALSVIELGDFFVKDAILTEQQMLEIEEKTQIERKEFILEKFDEFDRRANSTEHEG